MIRAIRMTAAIGAVALALGGCGGGSHTAARRTISNAVTTSTTAAGASDAGEGGSTTSTAKPRAKSSTTTAKASTATSSAGAVTATTDPAATIKATADRPCVHPGDVQGLTVTASPEGQVLYDSVYSDNSDALTKGYATGFGQGRADKNGAFNATWAVPANAPTGPARINVMAEGKENFEHAEPAFVVKPVTEPC